MMNKQLIFLTIKEANKPVHNNWANPKNPQRKWLDRNDAFQYYKRFFQKVSQEFLGSEDERFNSFCNLCRLDLKFNFVTYKDFEEKFDYQLN